MKSYHTFLNPIISYLLKLPEQSLLGVLLDGVPDLAGGDLELLAGAARDLAHEVQVSSRLFGLVSDVERDVVPHRDYLLAAGPEKQKEKIQKGRGVGGVVNGTGARTGARTGTRRKGHNPLNTPKIIRYKFQVFSP